jgi:hypothetical protein
MLVFSHGSLPQIFLLTPSTRSDHAFEHEDMLFWQFGLKRKKSRKREHEASLLTFLEEMVIAL